MAGAGGGAGGPGDKPVAMPVYGKTEYWDNRYTDDPEPFDWCGEECTTLVPDSLLRCGGMVAPPSLRLASDARRAMMGALGAARRSRRGRPLLARGRRPTDGPIEPIATGRAIARYQRYSGIAHFVHKYVKRDDAVLVAGCGNSRLSEDMVDDGCERLRLRLVLCTLLVPPPPLSRTENA